MKRKSLPFPVPLDQGLTQRFDSLYTYKDAVSGVQKAWSRIRRRSSISKERDASPSAPKTATVPASSNNVPTDDSNAMQAQAAGREKIAPVHAREEDVKMAEEQDNEEDDEEENAPLARTRSEGHNPNDPCCLASPLSPPSTTSALPSPASTSAARPSALPLDVPPPNKGKKASVDTVDTTSSILTTTSATSEEEEVHDHERGFRTEFWRGTPGCERQRRASAEAEGEDAEGKEEEEAEEADDEEEDEEEESGAAPSRCSLAAGIEVGPFFPRVWRRN